MSDLLKQDTYLNNVHKIKQKFLNRLSYPNIVMDYDDTDTIDLSDFIPKNHICLSYGMPQELNDQEPFLHQLFWKHELFIIREYEKYFGSKINELAGYVASGSTEGNFVAIWWLKLFLCSRNNDLIKSLELKVIKLQEMIKIINETPENNLSKEMLLEYKSNNIIITKYLSQLQSLKNPYIIYSDQSHFMIEKIIMTLSLKSIKICTINGKINVIELQNRVLQLQENDKYAQFIFFANLGTTTHGAFDDILSVTKLIQRINNSNDDSFNYAVMHCDGAYGGQLLPIIYANNKIKNYFRELNISSLSISMHKLMGTNYVNGLILINKEILVAISSTFPETEYLQNIQDLTFSGSRSTQPIIALYNKVKKLNLGESHEYFKLWYIRGQEKNKMFYDDLIKFIDKKLIVYDVDNLNILIPKPSKELIHKYYLMPSNDHVSCNLFSNHVNDQLIKQFLNDYYNDGVIQKNYILETR